MFSIRTREFHFKVEWLSNCIIVTGKTYTLEQDGRWSVSYHNTQHFTHTEDIFADAHQSLPAEQLLKAASCRTNEESRILSALAFAKAKLRKQVYTVCLAS